MVTMKAITDWDRLMRCMDLIEDIVDYGLLNGPRASALYERAKQIVGVTNEQQESESNTRSPTASVKVPGQPVKYGAAVPWNDADRDEHGSQEYLKSQTD